MKKKRITLEEAPNRRSICETKMRYIVKLDGVEVSELYYNMRGYRGYLPTPDGKKLDIGEKGINVYKAEIGKLNREFALQGDKK